MASTAQLWTSQDGIQAASWNLSHSFSTCKMRSRPQKPTSRAHQSVPFLMGEGQMGLRTSPLPGELGRSNRGNSFKSPEAAGARNVTTAATTKRAQKTTTTSRPPGWLTLAKITVTMNGLQSDSHPGGLNASRGPEPRSPPRTCMGPKEQAAEPLTVTTWNAPCSRPSAESGRPPPGPQDQAAAPRPVRAPLPAARRRTCAKRTCAGRGQMGWWPRPARPSSCFGLPPRAVIKLVSGPPQVRGHSVPAGTVPDAIFSSFRGHPARG